MKNKMLIVIGGLLAALLVVGIVGATVGYAQSSSTAVFHGHGPGDGQGGRGLGQVELDTAAKVLGMTSDELSTALQSGKTLERVATDKGVDIQKVQEAIQAAHATEMRDRIKQAVTDGTITQANADWLLEGLDKGYIGVPGAFGLGGPHGGHGLGDGNVPLVQPTQTSNP
jgi:hypothetical protein